MAREWVIPERADEKKVAALCGAFGVPPIVARVLISRGCGDEKKAARFLNKAATVLHPPGLMADMDKAAARIRLALDRGEKITVYGDYDVDGITSTALMVRALTSLGAETDAYIPDRVSEGYGVNRAALEKIAKSGTGLVITVDTGITATDEARFAGELGLGLIITDHHECREELPAAEAVVNPKRSDCPYPFKELAGVGVAFKLVCALVGDEREVLEKYGDIVALGTIADVVSLTDENRAIADFGINKMMKSPNPGLRAVLDSLGGGTKWDACSVVSYSVAPRLNAAGRMSSAMTAVKLLLTEDSGQAAALAACLDEENRRRQSEESRIFEQAVKMIYERDLFDKKAIVLAQRGWRHGIIGVVASRICDRFNRTCVLISIDDGLCKSSGRSVDGINLFDALSECSDILEKFGGHAYAAGFSIKEENIPELERRLNEFAGRTMTGEPVQKLFIDTEANLPELSIENVRATEALRPYGAGNKPPVFALRELTITEIRTLSGGKHCRLVAEKDGSRIEVIAFGKGSIAGEYSPGDVADLAGELNINNFGGVERVQLVLSDIRPGRFVASDFLPSRADFADVYRVLKRLPRPLFTDAPSLAGEITQMTGRRIGPEKLINALSVFADVGIVRCGRLGAALRIELAPNLEGRKVNLAESAEYIRIRNELCGNDAAGII